MPRWSSCRSTSDHRRSRLRSGFGWHSTQALCGAPARPGHLRLSTRCSAAASPLPRHRGPPSKVAVSAVRGRYDPGCRSGLVTGLNHRQPRAVQGVINAYRHAPPRLQPCSSSPSVRSRRGERNGRGPACYIHGLLADDRHASIWLDASGQPQPTLRVTSTRRLDLLADHLSRITSMRPLLDLAREPDCAREDFAADDIFSPDDARGFVVSGLICITLSSWSCSAISVSPSRRLWRSRRTRFLCVLCLIPIMLISIGPHSLAAGPWSARDPTDLKAEA